MALGGISNDRALTSRCGTSSDDIEHASIIEGAWGNDVTAIVDHSSFLQDVALRGSCVAETGVGSGLIVLRNETARVLLSV